MQYKNKHLSHSEQQIPSLHLTAQAKGGMFLDVISAVVYCHVEVYSATCVADTLNPLAGDCCSETVCFYGCEESGILLIWITARMACDAAAAQECAWVLNNAADCSVLQEPC